MLLVSILAAGCSESPQEKYNDALDHLSDVKEQAHDAQEEVTSAKKKLSKAKDQLKTARQKVKKAQQQVAQVVSDDVLFRALQKKMLDNDTFSDAAISVSVANRVVTLNGSVPDQDTKHKAGQIAQQQTGVAKVKNQLEVSGKQQDNSSGQSSNHDQHSKNNS
jgi:osmotically-inducible protein OsmY